MNKLKLAFEHTRTLASIRHVRVKLDSVARAPSRRFSRCSRAPSFVRYALERLLPPSIPDTCSAVAGSPSGRPSRRSDAPAPLELSTPPLFLLRPPWFFGLLARRSWYWCCPSATHLRYVQRPPTPLGRCASCACAYAAFWVLMFSFGESGLWGLLGKEWLICRENESILLYLNKRFSRSQQSKLIALYSFKI